MLQSASPEIKTGMETLLDGGTIIVNFDEQIVFEQLEKDENAIWSLLLASGYLKVKKVEHRGITLDPWYHLSITNLETIGMFSKCKTVIPGLYIFPLIPHFKHFQSLKNFFFRKSKAI